ncbi:unnamed protein product [Protopolystoma xenopodis]|uniref:Fibronectin type-III domain-containing protein n=1 Tax=Protopolystoma xenopodis TaxID=117903 RepID=A0A448WJ22_9PLAT|nr:unnamed protein product [Protopolystoma xenopodis]
MESRATKYRRFSLQTQSSLNPEPASPISVVVSGSENMLNLTGLMRGTEYNVTVTAEGKPDPITGAIVGYGQPASILISLIPTGKRLC